MRCNNNKDPLQVIGRSRGYSKKELLQYLYRHNNFSPNILRELKKIPDVVLRNMGTPFARKLNKMVKEISLEAYRAKQFTRTEINNRGVLYGIVLLKHKVIDSVLAYFHERWPKCVICLYNEHTKSTGIIDEKGKIYEINLFLKEVVEKISNPRPIIPYFDDIQISAEEIFETLYKSQHIPERDNKRYFKSMIPDYCYKLPGMRDAREKLFNPKDKKLDEFLK